jgi:hypothetical protein
MAAAPIAKRVPKSAIVGVCIAIVLALLYLVVFRAEIYVRNGFGSGIKIVEVRFNGRNVMEVDEWALPAEHGAAFNTLPAPISGRKLEFVLAPNPGPDITWSCNLEGPVRPWCYYEVFITRNGLVCNPCGSRPS